MKNATPATDNRRTSIKKPYDHLRGVCLQKLDDLVTEWSAEYAVLEARHGNDAAVDIWSTHPERLRSKLLSGSYIAVPGMTLNYALVALVLRAAEAML